MYFKKPVIVKLRWLDDDDMQEAVMELERAKAFIRFFKKRAKKTAYTNWLGNTKSQFKCMVCEEDNPKVLQFHHLGEQYTGMIKTDAIAKMIRKQLPLYRIESEMRKCVILCANCHQNIERGDKEAHEELYEMSERYYGKCYPPGETCDGSISNSDEFEAELKNIPIEIMGFFDPNYLKKNHWYSW